MFRAGLRSETSKVPNSCIESAEFIIQAKSLKKSYEDWAVGWTSGKRRKPAVLAKFGNDDELDITNDDLSEYNFSNLVDFDFTAAPLTLGEGLILMRRVWKSSGYNMHCGAVHAMHSGSFIVSNMMEPHNKNVDLMPLTTYIISSPEDFRKTSSSFTSKDYAIGKLVAQ